MDRIKTESEQRSMREMIGIAVPAMLESLAGVIIAAIDMRMIAPLGKDTVSAVGLTT